MSQEYEIRLEENARFATFFTDDYYAEVPVLESDSEAVIQDKIANAKTIIEHDFPPPE